MKRSVDETEAQVLEYLARPAKRGRPAEPIVVAEHVAEHVATLLQRLNANNVGIDDLPPDMREALVQEFAALAPGDPAWTQWVERLVRFRNEMVIQSADDQKTDADAMAALAARLMLGEATDQMDELWRALDLPRPTTSLSLVDYYERDERVNRIMGRRASVERILAHIVRLESTDTDTALIALYQGIFSRRDPAFVAALAQTFMADFHFHFHSMYSLPLSKALAATPELKDAASMPMVTALIQAANIRLDHGAYDRVLEEAVAHGSDAVFAYFWEHKNRKPHDALYHRIGKEGTPAMIDAVMKTTTTGDAPPRPEFLAGLIEADRAAIAETLLPAFFNSLMKAVLTAPTAAPATWQMVVAKLQQDAGLQQQLEPYMETWIREALLSRRSDSPSVLAVLLAMHAQPYSSYSYALSEDAKAVKPFYTAELEARIESKLRQLLAVGVVFAPKEFITFAVLPRLLALLIEKRPQWLAALGEHQLINVFSTVKDGMDWHIPEDEVSASWERLVGLHLPLLESKSIQTKILDLVPKALAGRGWAKTMAAGLRATYAKIIGRMGAWVDARAAEWSDPDVRGAMPPTPYASFHESKEVDITLTTHPIVGHPDDPAKYIEKDPSFHMEEWPATMRYAPTVIVEYLKLPPAMQALGLGQHTLQVLEQAVTRASGHATFDHAVLDFVHWPLFVATDVRYGWHDTSSKRKQVMRMANPPSIYAYFKRELGTRSEVFESENASNRIWSSPAARAIDRVPSEHRTHTAKFARLLTRALTPDHNAPRQVHISHGGFDVFLRREPVTSLRLQHHLLAMGSRDSEPMELQMVNILVPQMDSALISMVLLLLVELGRVWARPLRIMSSVNVPATVAKPVWLETPGDPRPLFQPDGEKKEEWLWVPFPRPRSFDRPANPDDEMSAPPPRDVPAKEPPPADADWRVRPGFDVGKEPRADGQPPIPKGRYDAHHHDAEEEGEEIAQDDA